MHSSFVEHMERNSKVSHTVTDKSKEIRMVVF